MLIAIEFLLETNTVIAVIPLDCLEESSFLKNLIAISYITVRVKTLSKFEMIEARIEQRSRINVDTIKSVRSPLPKYFPRQSFDYLVFNFFDRCTV